MTKEAKQTTETPYEQFRRSQSEIIAALETRLAEEQTRSAIELQELEYQIDLRRRSNNPRAQEELANLQSQRRQLVEDQSVIQLEIAIERKRQDTLDWYEGYVRGGINHIRNPEKVRDSGAGFWLKRIGVDDFMKNNFATESWRDIKPDSHPKAQELLTLHGALGIDVVEEACSRIFEEMNFTQAELELH